MVTSLRSPMELTENDERDLIPMDGGARDGGSESRDGGGAREADGGRGEGGGRVVGYSEEGGVGGGGGC